MKLFDFVHLNQEGDPDDKRVPRHEVVGTYCGYRVVLAVVEDYTLAYRLKQFWETQEVRY